MKRENNFCESIKSQREELRKHLKVVQKNLVKNFTKLQKYDPYIDYKKYLELTKKCHALIEEHDKIVTELL